MPEASKTVLVVDDEECIRRAAEAALSRVGYSPIAASNGLKALETSRGFKGEIHLLLTDVIMPGLHGLTMAEEIIRERPLIRVLLMSGHMSIPSRLPLLRKPFRLAELLEQVPKVIEAPPPLLGDVSANEASSGATAPGVLTQEVELKRRSYLAASRRFLATTGDVPTAMPGADGLERIKIEANHRRRAFADYQEAVKRLHEHHTGENTD